MKYEAPAPKQQLKPIIHAECTPELGGLHKVGAELNKLQGYVFTPREQRVPLLRLQDYDDLYEHDTFNMFVNILQLLKDGNECVCNVMQALGVSSRAPSRTELITFIGRAKCDYLARVVEAYATDERMSDLLVRFIRYVRTVSFVHSCRAMKLSLDHFDSHGYPRVTIAAVEGDFLSLYLLLKFGAKPNQRSRMGKSPLEHVIDVCDGQCCSFGLNCQHEIIYELLHAAYT